MNYKADKQIKAFAHIVLAAITVCSLTPFILLVSSSFTENQTIIREGYNFFTSNWSLEAYTYMFTSTNLIFRAYGISFILLAVGTIVGVSLTVSLGYVLSRQNLPGVKILNFFVIFSMLFNGGLVPTYLMYTGLFNIKNTFFALLIPNLLVNAFNVMIARSYFYTSVPNEILEAARIDGAGEFRTFLQVAVPIARPIIATIAMFIGIAYWNDWNNGFIYLTTNTNLYSIQNLLNRMMLSIQYLTQNATNLTTAGQGLASIPSASVRMAMAVMGVLPIIVIYPFVQKNFINGISLGGVKG
jgi:putative aldouronate transport system permease protein